MPQRLQVQPGCGRGQGHLVLAEKACAGSASPMEAPLAAGPRLCIVAVLAPRSLYTLQPENHCL